MMAPLYVLVFPWSSVASSRLPTPFTDLQGMFAGKGSFINNNAKISGMVFRAVDAESKITILVRIPSLPLIRQNSRYMMTCLVA